MFPFLLTFIVFLAVLTYYLRKNRSTQQEITESFWEKERQANAVRKKDISSLDYITIPLEKFPHKFNTFSENAFFALADKPMLNLTGISNTDLKLSYGTANLKALSEYDGNFTELVSVISQYASELLEIGETETARTLLEFGVGCKADSTQIYKLLADIYSTENNIAKIEELLTLADNLPTFTKEAVRKELTSYLP